MVKIGIDNFLYSLEEREIGDVNLYPNGRKYVRLFIYEIAQKPKTWEEGILVLW